MTQENSPSTSRLIAGFVAGFLATLIFHQLALSLLSNIGFAPAKMAPFNMGATWPLGIPVLFSMAFWGGLWGVGYASFDNRFPTGGRYWLTAFLVGAILPSVVALLIVMPLKGMPAAGGWNPNLIVTALLINGAWGVGTGLFLRLLPTCCGRMFGKSCDTKS